MKLNSKLRLQALSLLLMVSNNKASDDNVNLDNIISNKDGKMDSIKKSHSRGKGKKKKSWDSPYKF